MEVQSFLEEKDNQFINQCIFKFTYVFGDKSMLVPEEFKVLDIYLQDLSDNSLAFSLIEITFE